MHPPDLSSLAFSPWRPWTDRTKPSIESDGVPADFGSVGLYVLAASATMPTPLKFEADSLFPQEVVYIGTSTHVERRLERHHRAVAKYRNVFEDPKCSKLWFSHWHSDWWHRTNYEKPKPLALAAAAYQERALLLAYVIQYGTYPRLNLR